MLYVLYFTLSRVFKDIFKTNFHKQWSCTRIFSYNFDAVLCLVSGSQHGQLVNDGHLQQCRSASQFRFSVNLN